MTDRTGHVDLSRRSIRIPDFDLKTGLWRNFERSIHSSWSVAFKLALVNPRSDMKMIATRA